MSRAKLAKVAPLRRAEDEGEAPSRRIRTARAEADFPRVVAVTVENFDPETSLATLALGGVTVEATLDAAVSPIVMATAVARRERVIAQQDDSGWIVLGALRTTPTPGVDVGDEFVIQARRVSVEAEHRFSIISGSASFVMNALGTVETVADTIGAKARHVAKIIGSVIRLN